jgi:hypothetical protein
MWTVCVTLLFVGVVLIVFQASSQDDALEGPGLFFIIASALIALIKLAVYLVSVYITLRNVWH